MGRLVPWLTRRVLAWALYDVASSAYAGLVPTLFGVYFVSVVAGDAPGAQTWWGAIAATARVISGIAAPLVGAWSDRHGRMVGCMAAATVLCVAATIVMPTAAPGGTLWMAAILVAAQVGYTLAVALYDSLLVRVAPCNHAGRVSGFGWAVGFTGGISGLAAAIGLMQGVPDDAQAARLGYAFLIAGLLYASIAIPGLLGLRAVAGARARGGFAGTGVRTTFTAVVDTLRHWRSQREVFRFLIAYYLFNDVLVTVLFFIAIVLRARFGLGIDGLLWLALLYHCIALPATFAFGHAADRWGQRPTIYVMVTILGVALLLLAFATGIVAAVIVVILLGLVYGSLQAVCRSLLALLIHSRNAAEIFGFNAVAGRLSAALGPLIFGAVAATSGS
jgi:UMF1 family MFS transporter